MKPVINPLIKTGQPSEIRSHPDRISLLSATSIVYNEITCQQRVSRAWKEISKVVATLNNSRVVKWSWSGNRFVRQTLDVKTQAAATNRLQVYIRARLYQPSTGEFCSKDPLEYIDEMSLFRWYVLGGVDPFGFNYDEIVIAVVPINRSTHLILEIGPQTLR